MREEERGRCVQTEMPVLPGLLPEGMKSCAFSGHRELPAGFDGEGLREKIRALAQAGVRVFYFGGAVGFDLLAAECVLSLKGEFPLSLVACIPCAEQDKYYKEEDKRRYERVLRESDEKVLLSERYFRGCMHRRNDYMAERADALLAYCRRNTGGTAYTVKRFLRLSKPVFRL